MAKFCAPLIYWLENAAKFDKSMQVIRFTGATCLQEIQN